jgi:hypothetical protein
MAAARLNDAVIVVDEQDARRLARHQPREAQFDAAQRHRARPQQMILRVGQLLAHVDERELFAVGEHRLDNGGRYGAEHDLLSCVMAGFAPAIHAFAV